MVAPTVQGGRQPADHASTGPCRQYRLVHLYRFRGLAVEFSCLRPQVWQGNGDAMSEIESDGAPQGMESGTGHEPRPPASRRRPARVVAAAAAAAAVIIV